MKSSTLIALESWPLAEAPQVDLSCWQYCIVARRWKKRQLSELAGLVDSQGEGSDAFESVNVLMPSQSILCTSVEAPKKQHKHLEKILPFLCEEKVTSDLDSIHITAGSIEGESVRVRIVETNLLEKLTAVFNHWQLPLSGIYSELDLLSDHQALLHSDGFFLKTDGDGISTTPDNAAALINQWMESLEADSSTGLEIYCSGIEPSTELKLVTEQWIGDGADIQWKYIPANKDDEAENPIEVLSAIALRSAEAVEVSTDKDILNQLKQRLSQQGCNLLTGRFTPTTVSSSNFNWKPMAVAAGVLLAINLIYLVGSGFYWQQQAQQLRGESEALYREYFPQDRRIVNLKTQVQTHLNRGSGKGESGALRLLSEFLPGWQSHRNALTIKSLRYQQARNELLLDIDAKSIGDLDQLQQSLGQGAELLSANEDNGGSVRGRLKFQSIKPQGGR